MNLIVSKQAAGMRVELMPHMDRWMTDTTAWTSARIRNGNAGITTIAEFVEDSHGDLVDVIYHCDDWAGGEGAEWWPAYEWPDYDVYCADCHQILNKADDNG